MAFRVEVISKETIKPSSPTPHHLRTFKLSLLDQLSPATPVSLLLFYAAADADDNNNKLNQLKKSLSLILPDYYPFAGRIADNICVDCNDEGVNFFEARASCELNQLLVPHHQLLPPPLDALYPPLVADDDDNNNSSSGPKVILSIQATLFDCGGIALGVCITHKLVDAHSMCFFLTSWSALTLSLLRGDDDHHHQISTDHHHHPPKPKLGMTSFFPPDDTNIDHNVVSSNATEEILVTKRFVFDASNITALKAKCSSHNSQPTRVEAVYALIWSCCINIAPTKQPSAVWIVRNLRGRRPFLAHHFIGNLVDIGVVAVAAPTSTPPAADDDFCYLVGKLREAIRQEHRQDTRGISNSQLYIFNSWCRFPLYQLDFGWGNPTWVRRFNPATENVLNTVTLIDTKCGKGVEAWVNLSQQDMARFECEPQLVAFTSTLTA